MIELHAQAVVASHQERWTNERGVAVRRRRGRVLFARPRRHRAG